MIEAYRSEDRAYPYLSSYPKHDSELNRLYDRLENELKFADSIPYHAEKGIWRAFNKSLSKITENIDGKPYLTGIVVRPKKGFEIVIVASDKQDEFYPTRFNLRKRSFGTEKSEHMSVTIASGIEVEKVEYNEYDVIFDQIKSVDAEKAFSEIKKVAGWAGVYHAERSFENHMSMAKKAFAFSASVAIGALLYQCEDDKKIKVAAENATGNTINVSIDYNAKVGGSPNPSIERRDSNGGWVYPKHEEQKGGEDSSSSGSVQEPPVL